MRQCLLIDTPPDTRALIIGTLALLALPSRNAMADDFPGVYVGGAFGQSRLAAKAAGLARMQSTVNGGTPAHACTLPMQECTSTAVPPPFQQDRTNTGFPTGAGAQFKFGSWAVRAEYERFTAAGENPSLLSLGLTWRFL
jgi:opacity protein-like surface antigen